MRYWATITHEASYCEVSTELQVGAGKPWCVGEPGNWWDERGRQTEKERESVCMFWVYGELCHFIVCVCEMTDPERWMMCVCVCHGET